MPFARIWKGERWEFEINKDNIDKRKREQKINKANPNARANLYVARDFLQGPKNFRLKFKCLSRDEIS
jgi:hypothetical protein